MMTQYADSAVLSFGLVLNECFMISLALIEARPWDITNIGKYWHCGLIYAIVSSKLADGLCLLLCS